jgi:hypothetical protein
MGGWVGPTTGLYAEEKRKISGMKMIDNFN